MGRQAFRPYGDLVGTAIAAEAHGFAGERRDETGLIYLRARYYDPLTGRFIAADPTTSDGINRFMCARNNPVKFVDPTGFGADEVGEFNMAEVFNRAVPTMRSAAGLQEEPTGFRWLKNFRQQCKQSFNPERPF